MYQLGTALLGMKFHQSKSLLELGATFLKFEIQRSKVMVTKWPNMVQNTDLRVRTDSDPHCKWHFWRPLCDQLILSQPAGEGIPSTLQRQVLSCLFSLGSKMILLFSSDNQFSYTFCCEFGVNEWKMPSLTENRQESKPQTNQHGIVADKVDSGALTKESCAAGRDRSTGSCATYKKCWWCHSLPPFGVY